jgi:hypothetical protein
MLRKPVQRLATALGIIGGVIAIGQVFAPVRHWTGQRASDLYPVGWLVVAGVLLAMATTTSVVLWRRVAALRRALQEAHLAAAVVEQERDKAAASIASLQHELDPARKDHRVRGRGVSSALRH